LDDCGASFIASRREELVDRRVHAIDGKLREALAHLAAAAAVVVARPADVARGRRRDAAPSTDPHARSSLGPKSATTGVPIAAAMCIGAESTPKKRRARAVSAAISRR
jgi:hypothetical protein